MLEPEHIENLLTDVSYFKEHIANCLYENNDDGQIVQFHTKAAIRPSAVLFLLSRQTDNGDDSPEPCLVLNKRSSAVKQAGDLCCPGGGVSLPGDANLARLLNLPGSPLKRWPYWGKYKTKGSETIGGLKILLAASLRESYEEMRLNPLRVAFLGMLPAQRLGTFHRAIYPMVGWASHQKRFRLNWEVDKIVTIPIRHLLDPENYALTHFNMEAIPDNSNRPDWNDYPCFIHKQGDISEILWGATFRITMLFLKMTFGFTPPANGSLARIHSALNRNYYTGRRKRD